MKKVLSLVLTLLMVMSLSVVAFAKEVADPNTTPESGLGDADDKYDLGFGDLDGEESSGAPDRPGAVYYYTIMDGSDDSGMLTNAEKVRHLTVSIKEKGDELIASYAIVKQNGVYKVKVETKEFYTTGTKTADWTITLKRDKKFTEATANITITQGWADIDYAESDGPDELTVTVVETPAGDPGASWDHYTDDENLQWNLTMAKADKYATIYFGEVGDESPVWYSGKNIGKNTVNVAYDESVSETLATTYEDADLYAITFLGAPEFSTTGILHATVDKDMFVYAVEGGKLVADKFTWNEDAECYEMNTRKIEGVVVSDVELDVSKYNATVGDTGSTDKENPGTGSVDFVNVAIALGVVSLAAAGAVALKK